MAFEVKVPAVGESVSEGEIYQWHKKTGDYADMDEVLVELETDKATVEIVAEAAGIITIQRNEGETVVVGDVLAVIDTDAVKPTAARSPTGTSPLDGESAENVNDLSPQGVSTSEHSQPLSPAVTRMVSQHNIDVNNLEGTGRDGRLIKGDIVEHMDSKKVEPLPASPDEKPVPASGSASASIAPGSRNVRREKMSRLRQKIAERLVSAQHTAAMLTTFNEIDMTAVMDLRKKYKEGFKEKHGVGLGFMSFFVKATVEALKAYPEINGYVDEPELVLHDYQDIGVAVSTDKGLMVPVLRNCESMTFDQVESGILNYAKKGRDGKISVDDLAGGTFTISNGGTFGSLMSTPILNPPQSGILGMHKIEQRPVVVNGEIVIRPMMYVALSYDHRIVDGKGAVGFLVKIKENIEDPSRLLLGV